jgi:GT2 family glycosyltransferase
MARPLVSIVTANLNGRHHLEAFLGSVTSQDFPAEEIEVIVVDNGSSDGSLDLLTGAFPTVKLIENSANVGFARANNQGAEVARGRYLALLNNDIRLESDWVARMVERRERATPETVCVASRILSWDGSTVDFIDGGMAFNGRGFQVDFGVPSTSPEGTAYPDELLFACGAAMLIDRDVYLAVGGFDEDYFAYFEDVDLGWRLWVLGYRVVFCPDAVAYHRRNASQPERHRQTFLLERNALFSVFKNYDDASLAAFLPASLLLTFKRAEGWSGIDRANLASGTHAPAAPPPGARWRELLGRVRRRTARVVEGHPAGSFPVRREAYATVAAAADFLEQLPSLMEKRQRIQTARKRPDSEVVPLFRAPFRLGNWPSGNDGGYAALEALGVVDHLDSLLGDAKPAPAREPTALA